MRGVDRHRGAVCKVVDDLTAKELFTLKVLVSVLLILAVLALAVAYADGWTVKLVQASGGLNVRKEPNIHAKAVYLLDDCETVIVLEERDGWALVAKNNGDHLPLGWVCADYLK